MADTAPSCFRLTVQQLSRYLGFRTLRNWDIIYDVGQPTYYYLLHSLETPLALGCVAYIRKLAVTKLQYLILKFLEVVHCDIGFGDGKSIQSSFKQWFIDCVCVCVGGS